MGTDSLEVAAQRLADAVNGWVGSGSGGYVHTDLDGRGGAWYSPNESPDPSPIVVCVPWRPLSLAAARQIVADARQRIVEAAAFRAETATEGADIYARYLAATEPEERRRLLSRLSDLAEMWLGTGGDPDDESPAWVHEAMPALSKRD